MECSITYEKVIQYSNRQKDSLHKTIGSSTYTSNDDIKRCLKRKCAEELGMSQVKRIGRSLTGKFDF